MIEPIKYTNCDGEEKILDKGHYHELCDRVHCIREMWSTLIEDHPACLVLGELSEKVERAMGDCYQKAGLAMFDFEEE